MEKKAKDTPVISISKLPKTTKRTLKRVGRGLGSGKGKTAGRGAKGQNKRGKVPASFEGGQLTLIRRLPFRRDIGNRSLKNKVSIKLGDLNRLEESAEITPQALYKAGIIKKKDIHSHIKIVAGGKLQKQFTSKLASTKKAAEQLPQG